ncbi:MAG: TrkH family potassium uptake protein [Eubacteriales bacterium]|nr:TrkH family potassium uptake protein [Eubacteriales bacterium]
MAKIKIELSTPFLVKKLQKKLSPAQIITLSFLLIIIIGGVLLSLPVSRAQNINISVLDAFFTSVSAVCVTGLVTLTTATTWSIFGKIVILILIQIGGLSLISIFTFFMVNIGKKISLKSRLAIQAAFNNLSLGGMVRMVMFVIKGTLICELIGALFLFFSFLHKGVIWYNALFYGIFHSVSAFCNAGFDILGEKSLIPYAGNVYINIVVMTLIIIGGIGFAVWRDLLDRIRYWFSRQYNKRSRFSLHTKLALIMTVTLLILGTVFFLSFEYNNPQTIGNLPFFQKVLRSLFQSVTLRTAGFATIPQDGLTGVSKLFSSLYMFIGGSPGGTAGGIKTVTLAIILCSVWSIIKGRKKIVVFERTLSVLTLQKSLTITVLMLLMLFAGTAILSITENHSIFTHDISDLLFEVSSALGTVGLSTGITPFLSEIGKFVLMLCMFVGRIGPITLIISLSNGLRNGDDVIQYAEEDVMIG